ncbi:NYN domain limkain-b1-type [Arabidopsis suecica]|uniref:NYN domain limkain-b1-type n=1 Tax=Arabidopsis suecica TaxID=45249 RepID=A0A8T1ZVC0_ARASU|nr:NYN domain limkain-b1-type [Arabidopsis suecica]
MSYLTDDSFIEADTVVFWDMVDCPTPPGLDVVDVSKNIRETFRKRNYLGKMTTIYAYGDTDQIRGALKSPIYEVKLHENEAQVTYPLPKVIDYRGTGSIYCGDTNLIPVVGGHLKIVVNHTLAGEGPAKIRRIITDILSWRLDNRTRENFVLILGSNISECHLLELVYTKWSMSGRNIVLVPPENWEAVSHGIDSAGEGSQIEPSESSQLKRKDPPT